MAVHVLFPWASARIGLLLFIENLKWKKKHI